jgi:hypothetical protein
MLLADARVERQNEKMKPAGVRHALTAGRLERDEVKPVNPG